MADARSPNARRAPGFHEVPSEERGPIGITLVHMGSGVQISDETDGGFVVLNLDAARMVRDWLNRALP